VTFNR